MWELIKYVYEQIQLHDKQLDGKFLVHFNT